MTDEQLGNCKFQTANFCAVSFVNACRMLADLPDKNGWVTEDKVCWPTFMTSNERLSSQWAMSSGRAQAEISKEFTVSNKFMSKEFTMSNERVGLYWMMMD